MKTIVRGNVEKKVYEVTAFETPAISTERDRVRRERMIATPPRKLPSFSIVAPNDDAARRMIKKRYLDQRRHVRAFSRCKVSNPKKFAGAFVVYVEPSR